MITVNERVGAQKSLPIESFKYVYDLLFDNFKDHKDTFYCAKKECDAKYSFISNMSDNEGRIKDLEELEQLCNKAIKAGVAFSEFVDFILLSTEGDYKNEVFNYHVDKQVSL